MHRHTYIRRYIRTYIRMYIHTLPYGTLPYLSFPCQLALHYIAGQYIHKCIHTCKHIYIHICSTQTAKFCSNFSAVEEPARVQM